MLFPQMNHSNQNRSCSDTDRKSAKLFRFTQSRATSQLVRIEFRPDYQQRGAIGHKVGPRDASRDYRANERFIVT